MITIVNYGMGNLTSVQNALEYLGISCQISDDAAIISRADKLILPGVGAFGMAMDNLHQRGLYDTLQEYALVKRKPLLGICLGMQLLLDSSTEHGFHKGLSLVKGTVNFFGERITNLPVPHMGWNEVTGKKDSVLFKNAAPDASYYFVHSYHCEVALEDNVSGTTEYSFIFHSALEADNIFGCQFHPEKSQKNGLAIFSNFNSL